MFPHRMLHLGPLTSLPDSCVFQIQIRIVSFGCMFHTPDSVRVARSQDLATHDSRRVVARESLFRLLARSDQL